MRAAHIEKPGSSSRQAHAVDDLATESQGERRQARVVTSQDCSHCGLRGILFVRHLDYLPVLAYYLRQVIPDSDDIGAMDDVGSNTYRGITGEPAPGHTTIAIEAMMLVQVTSRNQQL